MRTYNFPKLILQNILRKKIRKELFISPCCPFPAPASLAREHKFSKKKLSAFHFFSLFFSLFIISLFSEEVGGHITEDTTWSPENNPYEVIENIRVDSGITLTILPGTEVRVGSAIAADYDDWHENFAYEYGTSVAKFFWIDGSIIAEGTSQDSIIFTRSIDDFDQYWGCIYIPENAENYRFKHCRFEYTAGIVLWTGRVAWGALNIFEGSGRFNHLFFYNNSCGVYIQLHKCPYEFVDNRFIEDENCNNFVATLIHYQVTISNPAVGIKETLFAHNYISGSFNNSLHSVNCVYNTMENNEGANILLKNTLNFRSYYYDNKFMNSNYGIKSSVNDSAEIYIRNNEFIDTDFAIEYNWNDNINGDIRENRFINSAVSIDSGNYGRILNNYVDGGVLVIDDPDMEVHNNITVNSTNGLYVYLNYNIYNNININSHYAICNNAISYTNCILVNNELPYPPLCQDDTGHFSTLNKC